MMRKQLALTLTLAAALAGLPWSGGTHGSGLAAPQSARSATRQLAGGAVVKTGPLVTQMVSPTLVVPVPGYADVYLANRSFPYKIPGLNGIDVAGRQNPTRLLIQVPPGKALAIRAKYGAADGFDAPTAYNADGYVKENIIAIPRILGMPRLGLSNIIAPLDSLVGVFTGPKPNSGRVPPAMDFGIPRVRDTAVLRPVLNQVFFIGTGTTSQGANKHFIIPRGAKYLYLGALNYAGSNHSGHGLIVASVTGTLYVPFRPVTPTPTATPPATPISQIGVPLPTDTATASPIPGQFSPVPGSSTSVPGAPAATGTPIPGQPTTTPVPPSATPIATSTATSTSTSTAVPIPTSTGTIVATPTLTSTPVPTPITQQVSETWSQFQNGYEHNGYQGSDYNSLNSPADLDPNANPNSPFYAGNLHEQTISPAVGGNVTVAGGPILALNGLYFTTGPEATLRCDWANGSPGAGYTCPGGFTSESVGSLSEDNVPVEDNNILYFLSHNGITPSTNGNGPLSEYNASTGAPYTFFNPNVALPTAPGVALTEYNGTCYVPTTTHILYVIDCAPNHTGTVLAQVPLAGTPLAGASVDPSANVVVVAVQSPGGSGGSLEAISMTTFAQPTCPSTNSQSWCQPLAGSTINAQSFAPFQPIVAGNAIVVSTSGGVFAFNASSGAPLWSRTGTVTGSGTTSTLSCSISGAGGGDLVPSGLTLSFSAEDPAAYDPFPTGSASASVFVGLPVYTGGTLISNDLVRLDASTGQVCAVGSGAPSAASVPISGPPVTVTGAPSTALLTPTDPRDVVFYTDNSGNVYALDANTLNPLVNTLTHAYPDQARTGLAGLTGSDPPLGASLIVANGHLYFGNGVGSIINYSF